MWNAKNGEVAVDDSTMYYVSFGYGDKPFIILPGLSDGLYTVKGKAHFLASMYKPLMKDYTIYVFSRKNGLPDGYSIKDMADDQAKVMRALGIEKAAIMGVSQGGMIAQAFAVYHPEMLEKLVIAVSTPNANGTVQNCVNTWIELARDKNYKQFVNDMNDRAYTQKYLRRYKLFYPLIISSMKRVDFDRFYANAHAILNFDIRNQLSSIICPTLILGGKEDKIVTPEASVELHESITNSHMYLYDGLGHAAFDEAKDFNERVLRFLKAE